MNTPEKTPVTKFVQLVQQGFDAWIQAGEFVAQQIDIDPEFPEKVNKACPQMSIEMVYRFELFGRRKLLPALCLNDQPGTRRLRQLPYSMQEKYANTPVHLLIEKDGKWQTLMVDVQNLTKEQADQVFTKDAIRTEAAQRAYIEDKRQKDARERELASIPEHDQASHIVGKKLVVTRATQFTLKDLARIMLEMQS